MKKLIFLLLFLLVLLPVMSAGSFGYDISLEREINIIENIVNYTSANVNNSLLWDGNAWSNTRWLNIDGSNANQDINIGIYDFYASNLFLNGNLEGLGIGSFVNTTFLIDGNIANGDATLVILSDINNNACINLTEGSDLGIQICYDGSGVNRGFVVSSMETSYEYFWVERDTGLFYINNNTFVNGNITADSFIGSGAELTNLNVTGLLNVTGDFTGYAINISFLHGATGIGGMDLRGDPWYLGGTDLQIAENLLVDGNVTASYFIGNGSQLTGIDFSPAGSDGEIQFNDGGVFGTDSTFTFNKDTNTMLAIKYTAGNQFSYLQSGVMRIKDFVLNGGISVPSLTSSKTLRIQSNGDMYFTANANSDTHIFIEKDNGNVGINTTTPEATLDIIGNVFSEDSTGFNHNYISYKIDGWDIDEPKRYILIAPWATTNLGFSGNIYGASPASAGAQAIGLYGTLQFARYSNALVTTTTAFSSNININLNTKIGGTTLNSYSFVKADYDGTSYYALELNFSGNGNLDQMYFSGMSNRDLTLQLVHFENISNVIPIPTGQSFSFFDDVTAINMGVKERLYIGTLPIGQDDATDGILKGAWAVGFRKDGANLILAGGQSTGELNNGASIIFQTSDVAVSAYVLQELSTKAILTGDGDFGIGTANPQNKLNVLGDGNFTGDLYYRQAFAFATSNQTYTNQSQWNNITYSEAGEIENMEVVNINETIMALYSGGYDIMYDLIFQDASPTPTAHVAVRVLYNGVEMDNSYKEVDMTRQNAELTIHKFFHMDLNQYDNMTIQWRASDPDVTVQCHGTYTDDAHGCHSATAYIRRIHA